MKGFILEIKQRSKDEGRMFYDSEHSCPTISAHNCYIVTWAPYVCYAMLCYVMLCYVMLCYVMLCYVMLYYIILYYVML